MKKTLVLFALAFAMIAVSSCSETEYDIYSGITGTVVDIDNGEPISQVTVTLTPGSLNTYTSSDGRFEFKNLESMQQQYTIAVQKSGYQPNRKTIETLAGETVDISITMKKQ